MTKAVVLTRDKEMKALAHQAAEGLGVKIAGDCRSVKEAVEIFRHETVRLVVLDLFLGESSGLDAIKTLRKMDENLTIILLSRMGGRSLLEKAFRLGASDTLIYPCGLDSLRQTIAHRLERINDGTVVLHE
jgi:DNA-binding response OmpR family regulator